MKTTLQKLNKVILTMLTLGMVLFTSCSKNSTEDAEMLLKTVPSSAQMVALLNAEQLVDDSGKENPLELVYSKGSEDFAKAASSIEPTYVVAFAIGYNEYITGFLSNPDKFKENIANGKTASENNGVWVCNDVAVIGNQFWLSRTTINPETVKGYSKLSETQSYYAQDYAKELIDSDNDIKFIADINGLLNITNPSNAGAAQIRLILSSFFDDAVYISGNVDFKKGELESEIKVLNKKMKSSKFVFPLKKVDVPTLKSIEGNAIALAALGVTDSFGKKIKESFGNMLNAFPADMLSALDALDGTLALAQTSPSSARGIISTGGNANAVMQLLSTQSDISTRIDGNKVIFETLPQASDVKGMSIAEIAPLFKDALLGFVINSEQLDREFASWASMVSVMAEPDNAGVKIEITCKGKDAKKNILESIIAANK